VYLCVWLADPPPRFQRHRLFVVLQRRLRVPAHRVNLQQPHTNTRVQQPSEVDRACEKAAARTVGTMRWTTTHLGEVFVVDGELRAELDGADRVGLQQSDDMAVSGVLKWGA